MANFPVEKEREPQLVSDNLPEVSCPHQASLPQVSLETTSAPSELDPQSHELLKSIRGALPSSQREHLDTIPSLIQAVELGLEVIDPQKIPEEDRAQFHKVATFVRDRQEFRAELKSGVSDENNRGEWLVLASTWNENAALSQSPLLSKVFNLFRKEENVSPEAQSPTQERPIPQPRIDIPDPDEFSAPFTTSLLVPQPIASEKIGQNTGSLCTLRQNLADLWARVKDTGLAILERIEVFLALQLEKLWPTKLKEETSVSKKEPSANKEKAINQKEELKQARDKKKQNLELPSWLRKALEESASQRRSQKLAEQERQKDYLAGLRRSEDRNAFLGNKKGFNGEAQGTSDSENSTFSKVTRRIGGGAIREGKIRDRHYLFSKSLAITEVYVPVDDKGGLTRLDIFVERLREQSPQDTRIPTLDELYPRIRVPHECSGVTECEFNLSRTGIVHLPLSNKFEVKALRFLDREGKTICVDDSGTEEIRQGLFGSCIAFAPKGACKVIYNVDIRHTELDSQVIERLYEYLPKIPHYEPTHVQTYKELLNDPELPHSVRVKLWQQHEKQRPFYYTLDGYIARFLGRSGTALNEAIEGIGMIACDGAAYREAISLQSIGVPALSVAGAIPKFDVFQLNPGHSQTIYHVDGSLRIFDLTCHMKNDGDEIKGSHLPYSEWREVFRKLREATREEVFELGVHLRELLLKEKTSVFEQQWKNSRFKKLLDSRFGLSALVAPSPGEETGHSFSDDFEISNTEEILAQALERIGLTRYLQTKLATGLERGTLRAPLHAFSYVGELPQLSREDLAKLPSNWQKAIGQEPSTLVTSSIAHALASPKFSDLEKQYCIQWLKVELLGKTLDLDQQTPGTEPFRPHTGRISHSRLLDVCTRQSLRGLDDYACIELSKVVLASATLSRFSRGSSLVAAELVMYSRNEAEKFTTCLNTLAEELHQRRVQLTNAQAYSIQSYALRTGSVIVEVRSVDKDEALVTTLLQPLFRLMTYAQQNSLSKSWAFVVEPLLAPPFLNASETQRLLFDVKHRNFVEWLQPGPLHDQLRFQISAYICQTLAGSKDVLLAKATVERQINHARHSGIAPDFSNFQELLFPALARAVSTLDSEKVAFNFPRAEFPASRLLSRVESGPSGEIFKMLLQIEAYNGVDMNRLAPLWPAKEESEVARTLCAGLRLTLSATEAFVGSFVYEKETEDHCPFTPNINFDLSSPLCLDLLAREPTLLRIQKFCGSIKSERIPSSSEADLLRVRELFRPQWLAALDELRGVPSFEQGCASQIFRELRKQVTPRDLYLGLLQVSAATISERDCAERDTVQRKIQVKSAAREIGRFGLADGAPEVSLHVPNEPFYLRALPASANHAAILVSDALLRSRVETKSLVSQIFNIESDLSRICTAPTLYEGRSPLARVWGELFLGELEESALSDCDEEALQLRLKGLAKLSRSFADANNPHFSAFSRFITHEAGFVAPLAAHGEFIGYRSYVPGDDFRAIDWAASSRSVSGLGNEQLKIQIKSDREIRDVHYIVDMAWLAQGAEAWLQATEDREIKTPLSRLFVHLNLCREQRMNCRLALVDRSHLASFEMDFSETEGSHALEIVPRKIVERCLAYEAIAKKEGKVIDAKELRAKEDWRWLREIEVEHDSLVVAAIPPEKISFFTPFLGSLRASGNFVRTLKIAIRS